MARFRAVVRWSIAVCGAWLATSAGCATPTRRQTTSPPVLRPEPSTTAPAPTEPAAALDAATSGGADAAPADAPAGDAAPSACAEVEVSVDLRALPRNTSAGHIDLFVRGQAWDLAGHAPPDARPEVYTSPGSGTFRVAFHAPDPRAATAHCTEAVAAYLRTAPRLPIVHSPAAVVRAACAPCSVSGAANDP